MNDTSESHVQADTVQADTVESRAWLLLIHQIPADPAYLRVKVSRRLRSIGAVALKNSVYLLPDGEEAREDFHWLRREIVAGGGEATLSTVQFLEGTRDDEVVAMFEAERRAEYTELAAEARGLADTSARAALERLRRRLDEITARDHLGSPARAVALQALSDATDRLRGEQASGAGEPDGPRGATWVTRRGVFVDRMASAWLIRRFIDPQARFRFVADDADVVADEYRFDMYEGGFTHEGDGCTFETLLAHFGLDDGALRAIAEIVHDIDLKDRRYQRPETQGIASLVRGIATSEGDDDVRITAAARVFDILYAQFRAAPS